jgi:hypothetical protein
MHQPGKSQGGLWSPESPLCVLEDLFAEVRKHAKIDRLINPGQVRAAAFTLSTLVCSPGGLL